MIIGIDPGLSGAVAFLNYDGTLRAVLDLPTLTVKKKTVFAVSTFAGQMQLSSFERFRAPRVYLEAVHAMPVQNGFSLGRTLGQIHGVLVALGYDVVLVPPQTWKFNVGLNAVPGATMKDRKNASRELAMKLFPDHTQLFKRAKDDGRAEAALIGWYGFKLQEAK